MKKHIKALTIPILSLLLITTINLVASPLPITPTESASSSSSESASSSSSKSASSQTNQPTSYSSSKSASTQTNQPTSTSLSSTIKAINCRDFIVDTEIFTNTERTTQIECEQFTPTENLITGTLEPPETIQSLDMYIYNFSKSYNVDVDIVKAIACVSFTDYSDTVQRTATNLGEFLQINVPILERNLQRYNGDYLLAIEAMYRGVSDIDILYATFGNEWDKHIKDIEYLTGACYVEQKEKLITTPYYIEVMKYYRRYEDEH